MQKYKVADCFAHQKFMLRLLGLSIPQNVFYKIYCIISFIILTIYPISVLPNIIKLFYDINKIMYSLMFEIAYITGLFSEYYKYLNSVKIDFWSRQKFKFLCIKFYNVYYN